MMKKRNAYRLAVLGLALFLLAGCAGEKDPQPSQASSEAPAQSQGAEPAATSVPTATPEPSAEPAATPEPSTEPDPTAAPEPSAAPAPSAAPEPTKAPEPTPTPAPQGPEDGNYTANVTLSGGTGRASIQSPAKLRCVGGQFTATILWSSPNFDYMKVNGTRYELVSAPGSNSAFEIPVAAFDTPLTVVADTVAMSEPHEVEYTLTFDSASLAKQ